MCAHGSQTGSSTRSRQLSFRPHAFCHHPCAYILVGDAPDPAPSARSISRAGIRSRLRSSQLRSPQELCSSATRRRVPRLAPSMPEATVGEALLRPLRRPPGIRRNIPHRPRLSCRNRIAKTPYRPPTPGEHRSPPQLPQPPTPCDAPLAYLAPLPRARHQNSCALRVPWVDLDTWSSGVAGAVTSHDSDYVRPSVPLAHSLPDSASAESRCCSGALGDWP